MLHNLTPTPRVTLGHSGVRDLAIALVQGVSANIPYASLADVVELGPGFGIDPKGIELARRRLQEAADGGNDIARQLLADIARAEAGEAA